MLLIDNLMEPFKWNPENNGKHNLVTWNCKTQLIRQVFWLIQFNLTIKTLNEKKEEKKLYLEIKLVLWVPIIMFLVVIKIDVSEQQLLKWLKIHI